ncbi:HNH endonuclease [Paracoccus litorisediminis]|uniref:HNH endonuclease n=1 Tax=Paracoccus litorisediminis TaxID=2006130 RepID=UPI0037317102
MTLAYPALVLNADFTPVSLFPVSFWDLKRTFSNVRKGRVMVLETYDRVFRAAGITYPVPSVVALKDFIKKPDHVPFNRLNLFIRDDFRCQYCGTKHAPKDLTFDHVVPRAHGGRTNWENIVSACIHCNSRKGSRTDIRPMVMPTRPSARKMIRKQPPRLDGLHRSQIDYLYWGGVLESD